MKKRRESTNNDATAPGWRIPVTVQDEHRRWCELHHLSLEGECSAAIFFWPHVPAEVRDWVKQAMAGRAEFDERFWEEFSAAFDAGVRELKIYLRQRSGKAHGQ